MHRCALWSALSSVFLAACQTADVIQATPGDAAIAISVKPDAVYIELSRSGQHLSFDFQLANAGERSWLLTAIDLSVFDAEGRLAYRDFVDRYSRPCLELEASPALPARASCLVFNPFHSFAADVPLARLRFAFTFTGLHDQAHQTVELDVSPVVYQPRTRLILPVRGRVLVWDGHDHASHHRRFDYTHPAFADRGIHGNFQRYGYDFVVVDDLGTMYRGPAKRTEDWYEGPTDDNRDYYGFGGEIVATADGTVADLHDGEPDNRSYDRDELRTRETAYGGNYVIIDHGNGEFSWFGHLQQDSIRVRRGQQVEQGEVIARMGASGDSLFPHLHYELRTGIGAKHVEGLPSYFSGCRRVLGAVSVELEQGRVDSGELLESW